MILLICALLLMVPARGSVPEGDVTLTLDLSRYQVRGEPSAKVLVLEFSDFKCHACEKFNLTIMPNLDKEFIRSGKVKVGFVDFPLIDEASYTTVAESVHCAGRQGKYWPMHDTLWENTGALGDKDLAAYAAKLGLDVAAFQQCLDKDQFRQRVLDDLKYSYGLGLSSRPTFFIGRRAAGTGANTYQGRYVVGAQSYIVFKSLISRMMDEAPVP